MYIDKRMFLLLIFVCCLKDASSAYVYKHSSGLCHFRGYRAARQGEIDIPKIEAPIVKNERKAIATISGRSAQAAGISKELVDGITSIGKTVPVPKLAFSLGIFGAVFGAFSDIQDLTPDDIIEATNKAVKELTDEINVRFKLMKKYVDKRVIRSDVMALKTEIESFYNSWNGCLKKYTVASEAKLCQRQLANRIEEEYPKFLLFIKEIDTWNQISYKDLDGRILELEAFLIISRDYTNLGIKVIQTVINEYKNNDQQYYNLYRQILQDFTKRSIDYIKKAYSWIEKFHITYSNKKCEQTVFAHNSQVKEKRKVLWSTTTLSHQVRTGCWIDTAYVPASWCHMDLEILDSNYVFRTQKGRHQWYLNKFGKSFRYVSKYGWRSYKDLAYEIAKPELQQMATYYFNKYRNAIKNHWDNELMGLIPTWEMVIKYAKTPRTTRPPCNRPPQFC